jgi:hypothetical protein
MDKRETNRAKQLPIDKEYIKGVSLIDIDTTIAEYMSDVIIPDLEENGNILKAPLIYGNAERWAGARKEGYLRDARGRIQTPLVMFKRNSIERNSTLQHFKEQLAMPAVRKYSPKNRYERFNLQSGVAGPAYENYSVAVPSYVTLTYEVMIWTSFTEHMNKIVEAFQYATDRYWGNEDGYKFRTKIDSFENQQEVGEGTERVIRTTFTMAVNAYLLPEVFDKKPVVKKRFTPKRVIFGIETDLTGNSFSNGSVYNEYSNVINFIAVRGSQLAEFVNSTTIKLTNVSIPILPKELIGSFDTTNWFRVYLNGKFISPSLYTYNYNSFTNEIVFSFVEPCEWTNDCSGFEDIDEIAITGKFEQI